MVAIGHLLLYSPLLPPAQATKPSGEKDEDAHEAAQVAFYSSSDNVGTRDGMLRSLGLAKGLENFVDMLSLAEPASWPDDGEIADDGTTVVTSTTSTMLTLSLEASFRLHVRFTNSSTPGQAEVSAPPDPLPPVSALKAVLRRACARFHLLHGPLTGLLSATGLDKEPESDVRVRHKLQSAVERYWSEWIDRFAARADSLLVDSHGLALPTIVTAANRTEAKLAQPYALISSTSITSSLSEQLPAELLHHLLSLVPPPDGPSSCAEAQYGGLELKDDPKRTNGTTSGSWWDGLGGLGSSMAGLTLGLGKNGSLARSLSPTASIAASERKSTSQTSSLWRKATADLLSFGSSAPLTPIAARLSPRLQDRKLLSSAPDVGPLSPAALSTSTASPPDPTLGGMTIDGAVDASTLKEAMEQDLPPPESVALRWAEAPVWLPRSGDRVQFIIATTVLPADASPTLAKRLFAYLRSLADPKQHPSLETLEAAFGSVKPPQSTTIHSSNSNGLYPEGSVDHQSFATTPIKPTLSRSPSAISLLSTFSTPPRPASSPSPLRNAPVSALVRLDTGEALTNGPWKNKGGKGARRERSVVRGLDLLHGPEIQEAVTRTSLASTWIAARKTASPVAEGELVTIVESKGINLGDVTRFSRQAERDFERQLTSREAGRAR